MNSCICQVSYAPAPVFVALPEGDMGLSEGKAEIADPTARREDHEGSEKSRESQSRPPSSRLFVHK